MANSKELKYQDGTTQLKGYISLPEDLSYKTPAILVVHDWSGRNKFACDTADQLAELGYIGFAVDMYGDAKIASTKEEKTKLMQPFMQDREKLQKRMLAAFEAIKKVEWVDDTNIGTIGFCFGGLCALDLARTGADVKAVVSFHGLLIAPENGTKNIKSKILALHGYKDPMVTPDQVMAFAEEMTGAKADWQLTMYGNVVHAFTNPEANDPAFGTVYDKKAAERAWIAMQLFFQETF